MSKITFANLAGATCVSATVFIPARDPSPEMLRDGQEVAAQQLLAMMVEDGIQWGRSPEPELSAKAEAAGGSAWVAFINHLYDPLALLKFIEDQKVQGYMEAAEIVRQLADEADGVNIAILEGAAARIEALSKPEGVA